MTTPLSSMNDGATIPQIGFGTVEIPAAETERAVAEALDAQAGDAPSIGLSNVTAVERGGRVGEHPYRAG